MKIILLLIPAVLFFAIGAFFGGRTPAAESAQFVQPPERETAPVSFEQKHDSFDAALAESDLFQRELSLTYLLGKAGKAQCRKLFLKHQSDSHLRRLIAARWSDLDPRGFATFLEGNGKKWQRDPAVREALFLAWTAADPDAAYTYASAVSHPDVRGEFLREVFGNLLYLDRDKMIEYVGNETDRALLYVRGSFEDSILENPEASGDFIKEMPDSLFRMHASQLLAKRWGQTDPEKAIAFAEEVEPNDRDSMVALALSGWMRTDPEAARAYVDENGLPKGVHGGEAGASLAGYLGKTDPVGALEWVEANLNGRARADALARLVKSSAPAHPEAAAAIASDLPAGAMKTEGFREIAKEWFTSDAESAVEWSRGVVAPALRKAILDGIASSGMPREEKGELSQRVAGSE